LVNVALKIALVSALAQVGLALATAAGAWINLLLVVGFAARKGYLELDRALLRSLAKFVVSGIILGAALWFTGKFAAVYFAQMSAFRDETALLLLTAVGAFVYALSVLLLFGRGWLFSLVRS
jgi:putative peptidoglycan lipid II flippase